MPTSILPLLRGSAISRKKKELKATQSIQFSPNHRRISSLTGCRGPQSAVITSAVEAPRHYLPPPPLPVYFSLIKISQSVSLLAGRVARVREADRGGVKGRSAYDGGTDGRADRVSVAPCVTHVSIWCARWLDRAMLDIKGSADYLSRSGTFTNFSMLFAGEYAILFVIVVWSGFGVCVQVFCIFA